MLSEYPWTARVPATFADVPRLTEAHRPPNLDARWCSFCSRQVEPVADSGSCGHVNRILGRKIPRELAAQNSPEGDKE